MVLEAGILGNRVPAGRRSMNVLPTIKAVALVGWSAVQEAATADPAHGQSLVPAWPFSTAP